MIDADPNLITAGGNSAVVIVIVYLMKNAKTLIRLWQTRWEKSTDLRLIAMDLVIEDVKKEVRSLRGDFDDLKKQVTQTLARLETHTETLSKIGPAIAGFVANSQKRFEKVETEVIQLGKDIQLVRDKK